MPTDEEFNALKEIVVLQSEIIGEIANALDQHDLDGPHYTELHQLDALTRRMVEKFKVK